MQPDLPATLVQAVDRALSPDPGDRFPGAEAMRDALSAVTTGTTSPPCPEPDARVASRSWRPTAAPMRVALAGVLLVGVIAVVVTLRGGWRDPGTATSPLSFSPGDWVLVTALENRAGI